MVRTGWPSFIVVVLALQQAALGQVAPGYSSGGSEFVLPSDSTPIVDSRCLPVWEHRSGWFGDYLYMKARDVDLAYATHVDGPIQNAVPLAPTSVVVPDYEPGFRIGRNHAVNAVSSIAATFWYYSSGTSDSLELPGGTGWIRPEVTHPDTAAADFDKLVARADYQIDFQMADLTYQAILRQGPNYAINYVFGLRYAHLDQEFLSEFSVLGVRTVDTRIRFDGLGARLGLEGEQRFRHGFRVYAEAYGNLLAGEFNAEYQQEFNLAGLEASAGIEDHRIVPQLELGLGLAWQDDCGKLRIRAGYYVGSWLNIATIPTWIDAVQTNNVTEVDESLTFDGLIARLEYRF